MYTLKLNSSFSFYHPPTPFLIHPTQDEANLRMTTTKRKQSIQPSSPSTALLPQEVRRNDSSSPNDEGQVFVRSSPPSSTTPNRGTQTVRRYSPNITTLSVSEEMHKFIAEQLNTSRVPLCINPQSAAFKSFAR